MVMAGREGVDRASAPVTAVALIGLGEQMINALVKVPFSRPWSGASDPIRNTGASVSRAVLRSFLGFSTSLPIDEFRSVEAVLDQVCETVSAGSAAGLVDISYARRGRAGRMSPCPRSTPRSSSVTSRTSLVVVS
jgi:hypothetical protein